MAQQITIDTSYTDEMMLASVRQAIMEIQTYGASYALPGGRQHTKADLSALSAREELLLARIASESNGMSQNLASL